MTTCFLLGIKVLSLHPTLLSFACVLLVHYADTDKFRFTQDVEIMCWSSRETKRHHSLLSRLHLEVDGVDWRRFVAFTSQREAVFDTVHRVHQNQLTLQQYIHYRFVTAHLASDRQRKGISSFLRHPAVDRERMRPVVVVVVVVVAAAAAAAAAAVVVVECIYQLYVFSRLVATSSSHHTTTVLRPFFQDHPGEPVPDENFWTLWCKGRLTEADRPGTGRHSIQTNQCPPPPSPNIFLQAGCPSCHSTNSVKAQKATSSSECNHCSPL